MEQLVSYYAAQFSYLGSTITQPTWHNFFWWLVGLSVAVWLLEIIVPWRKNQPVIRKDFWLDTWYMFFNMFIFGAIGYSGISTVVRTAVSDAFPFLSGLHGVMGELPKWALLLIIFVSRDFIQWNVHRLLHASSTLWEFHKVHHSVEQMGFAAHLRFHFAENIVYGVLEYIPLMLLGINLVDFFAVGVFATAVGHLNHANIVLPIGPLKYLFNTPQMHIWHHAKNLPEGVKSVNYGLTLSVWDWLFGTAYMPTSGRDITLGFEDVEHYPHGFFHQVVAPFTKRDSSH
ncbi:MAG: sterol desaturase family protein [Candidatus Kapabacteria bacterium]|nr:sterol desaturase family protein [Candidatus Kapabacteria bacterium]